MIRTTLLALLFSATAQAGTGSVSIVGTGDAAAAPERVRFTVSVTSLCYDSSRAAKDANAVLANRIVEVLHGFASGTGDRVTTTGGYNVRQTEQIWVDGTAHTLCTLKWRAANSVTLEMSASGALADLQDVVLAAIDGSAVDPQLAAQSYAELGQPAFSLSDPTMRALRAQAQALAYDDAKAQFDVFAARCHFDDPRLTAISSPEFTASPRRDGVVLADSAGSATPIIPDDIDVRAAWTFEWTFAPTAGCRR